jgi:hypothetical protein
MAKTAYFTFGRFQPPTVGHALLIRTVYERAVAAGGDAFVFVSSSKNNMEKYLASRKYKEMNPLFFESMETNKNPLTVGQKVYYMTKMFSDMDVRIVNTTEFGSTQITDIVFQLGPEGSLGYQQVVFVVGSDRVSGFRKIFKDVPYVRVESAGDARTNNAVNTLASISGTKMRIAAVNADFGRFKRGVMIGSMTEGDAYNMMNDVRVGLGYAPLSSGGLRKTRRVVNKSRRRSSRRLNNN